MSSYWRRLKPPAGSMIDWGHPLASQIYFAAFGLEAQGRGVIDLVQQYPGVMNGVGGWVGSEFGSVWNFLGTSASYVQFPPSGNWGYGLGQTISVACWFKSTQAWNAIWYPGSGTLFSMGTSGSGSTDWMLCVGSDTAASNKGQVIAGYGPAGGGNDVKHYSIRTGLNDGLWHRVLWSRDKAKQLSYLFIDGKLDSTFSTNDTGAAISTPNRALSIGYDTGGGAAFLGQMFGCMVWNGRVFNAVDAALDYAEPFAILRVPDIFKRYFLPSAFIVNRRTSSSLGSQVGTRAN